jgi:hypothetical protein
MMVNLEGCFMGVVLDWLSSWPTFGKHFGSIKKFEIYEDGGFH